MTIDAKENKGISDFLLEVTQAGSFKELEKAYQRVKKEFEDIISQDSKGRTRAFATRFNELTKVAGDILKEEANGNTPTEKQLAVFGEMVALRDACHRRLNG